MSPSWQTQESRVYRTLQSLGTLSFGRGFSGEVVTPLVFGLLSATSVHFLVGTPNRLLWSDKFGPFFAEARYPSLPRVSSRAPTLERRSLPSKGYGQSGTCRKEWVTLSEARCTFRSVVHRHNFPPVAPCSQAALVLMGPLVLVSTEC